MTTAIYHHDDPRALFPYLDFVVFDFTVAERVSSTVSSDIAAWRMETPDDFGQEILPMIQVTTMPPAVAAVAAVRDIEYKLDAGYRTWIWVRDRRGWRAAYRLARIIASGRKVCQAEVEAVAGGAVLKMIAAPRHFRGRFAQAAE